MRESSREEGEAKDYAEWKEPDVNLTLVPLLYVVISTIIFFSGLPSNNTYSSLKQKPGLSSKVPCCARM